MIAASDAIGAKSHPVPAAGLNRACYRAANWLLPGRTTPTTRADESDATGERAFGLPLPSALSRLT